MLLVCAGVLFNEAATSGKDEDNASHRDGGDGRCRRRVYLAPSLAKDFGTGRSTGREDAMPALARSPYVGPRLYFFFFGSMSQVGRRSRE